jgi:hypothetical protein
MSLDGRPWLATSRGTCHVRASCGGERRWLRSACQAHPATEMERDIMNFGG